MKITATKVFLKLLVLGIASLYVTLFGQSRVFAVFYFNRTIDTTVELVAVDQVKVTQLHRLSWTNPNFMFPASRNYLYAYIYPAFTTQEADLESKVTDIKVTSRFADNRALSFTQTIEDGAIQLKIPYYDNLQQGRDLEFSVTYKTSLYTIKQGGILEFSYPGLSKDFKASRVVENEGYTDTTKYTLSVVVPAKLGEISTVYPSPLQNKAVNGKQTIVYGASHLVANSVRITLGNGRYIKFLLTGKTYPTSQDTPDFVKGLFVNYIEVALPSKQEGTESGHQEVYYTKIEPFPVSLTTDVDGNLIAKIPVSAAKEGEITIEGYAALRNIPISEQTKQARIVDIPTTMSGYTVAEPKYWQVDSSEIQAIALKEAEKQGLIYNNIRKTLTYVSQNLTYPKVQKESVLTRLGAVNALSTKIGVCMEYSDLSLSILRAQKIPTRAVFGDGVGARVDRTLAGIGHQWVGVWFPNQGWIPVDPTWSDNGNEYIGHDFDHFVWYVASKSVNEPSGFNCLSWDSQSPCKEALRIDTSPVDVIPTEGLLSISTIKQQVLDAEEKNNATGSRFLQGVVSYLGGSLVGRMLLSNQAMLIYFSVILYGVLVIIVRGTLTFVRKRRESQS